MPRTSIYPLRGKLNIRTKFTAEHNRWNYENTRRFIIAFHKHREKDMLDWLEARKPYQTTVKRLIREEMAREEARKAEEKNKAL